MNPDIEVVAEGIKKLGREEALEVGLCLLTSLLPYQLRLSACSDPQAQQIGVDFTQYLTELRDALVGPAE